MVPLTPLVRPTGGRIVFDGEDLLQASDPSLQVRVGFRGPGGSELVYDGFDGADVDLPLGAWPAGTQLWVAAANPTSAGVDLALTLE